MITRPDSPELTDLVQTLAAPANATDASGEWPAEQLAACGRAGVFRWFLGEEYGGYGWSDADVVRGYLALSEACLTTTFAITQRTGACQRIAGGFNDEIKGELLSDLAAGTTSATIGISHLTTSRRHLAKPVLSYTESDDGFVLDGFSPWVTGAAHADLLVLGAQSDDAQQILVVVPTSAEGISVPEPARLTALTASCTGEVRCDGVFVPRDRLLAGPVPNVMAMGVGGGTGGLQTSTLALGLSRAAVKFVLSEAANRDDLETPAEQLAAEVDQAIEDLLAISDGARICTAQELRARANRLALRTSQAALVAAKGSGYVIGHPAGRWCREAMFFLVWSCPQPIAAAHLCEFAGLAT